LQQLQSKIGSANLGSLLALRSDVVSASNSATALANQATSTAASAVANTNLSPAQRVRANIEAVQRDLFDKRVLDPYLQFASAEDEEAYRKRERERNAEVRRALALRTPEGDRRATELVEDQLRDADAHVADRSPDFAAMLNQNAEAKNTLVSATPAAAPLAGKTKAPSLEVSDIAAALRAAGLTGDAPAVDESGHGLSFDKLANATRTVEGRT
jgi:hypothetical protein